MRHSLVGRALFLSSFPLTLAGSLVAQAMAPPAYLQIFREEVKPGRSGLHPAVEAGWPRAFAKARIGNHYTALATIYGPEEAWFCAGVQSIAEIEQQNQAIEKAAGLTKELDRLAQADAANISKNTRMLARYRRELSNGPDFNPAEMRVWEALVFKVKPGHEADFAQAAQLYRGLVESAKTSYPWATFEVMAGMPGPAFLVFIPHKTLAEIDPATGAVGAIEKAMTMDVMKKFGTLFEGFNSVETLVFSVSPEMSYPHPDWVKQDAAFWGRRVSTAASTAPTSRAGSQ